MKREMESKGDEAGEMVSVTCEMPPPSAMLPIARIVSTHCHKRKSGEKASEGGKFLEVVKESFSLTCFWLVVMVALPSLLARILLN